MNGIYLNDIPFDLFLKYFNNMTDNETNLEPAMEPLGPINFYKTITNNKVSYSPNGSGVPTILQPYLSSTDQSITPFQYILLKLDGNDEGEMFFVTDSSNNLSFSLPSTNNSLIVLKNGEIDPNVNLSFYFHEIDGRFYLTDESKPDFDPDDDDEDISYYELFKNPVYRKQKTDDEGNPLVLSRITGREMKWDNLTGLEKHIKHMREIFHGHTDIFESSLDGKTAKKLFLYNKGNDLKLMYYKKIDTTVKMIPLTEAPVDEESLEPEPLEPLKIKSSLINTTSKNILVEVASLQGENMIPKLSAIQFNYNDTGGEPHLYEIDNLPSEIKFGDPSFPILLDVKEEYIRYRNREIAIERLFTNSARTTVKSLSIRFDFIPELVGKNLYTQLDEDGNTTIFIPIIDSNIYIDSGTKGVGYVSLSSEELNKKEFLFEGILYFLEDLSVADKKKMTPDQLTLYSVGKYLPYKVNRYTRSKNTDVYIGYPTVNKQFNSTFKSDTGTVFNLEKYIPNTTIPSSSEETKTTYGYDQVLPFNYYQVETTIEEQGSSTLDLGKLQSAPGPLFLKEFFELFDDHNIIDSYYGNGKRGNVISTEAVERYKKEAKQKMTKRFLEYNVNFFTIDSIFSDDIVTNLMKMRILVDGYKTFLDTDSFSLTPYIRKNTHKHIDEKKTVFSTVNYTGNQAPLIADYNSEVSQRGKLSGRGYLNRLHTYQKNPLNDNILRAENLTTINTNRLQDYNNTITIKDSIIKYDKNVKKYKEEITSYKNLLINNMVGFFFSTNSFDSNIDNFYIKSYETFLKGKLPVIEEDELVNVGEIKVFSDEDYENNLQDILEYTLTNHDGKNWSVEVK